MDAPSAQLRSLLAELGLADDRQLRRCRPIVRTLVRDLPAFDSVWIDALVQCRRLTLFQAEVIAEGRGEQLCIGPYVLIEPLHRDERLTMYRSRHLRTGDTVQLTRVDLAADEWESASDRLEKLVGKCSEAAARRSRQLMSLPLELVHAHGAAWLAAPLVEGLSCAALLVRRGRFPPGVVEPLARQLLSSLAAAEAEGLCHGDLRPSNVVLTRRGQVVLRNWGILSSVVPAVTIHASVPLESLSALPPERIREPLGATPCSDVYSAGCLLWQLLAGRGPFLSADPLALRAAHLRRRIPDPREFAPATSTRLARLIARMTERDPAERLPSFTAAEAELTARSPHRIARFVTSFESAAPRPLAPAEHAGSAGRTVAAATLLAAATVGGLLTYQQHLKENRQPIPAAETGQPIPPGGPLPPVATSNGIVTASYEVPESNAANGISRPIQLPQPTADGVIELAAGRRYRAAAVNHSGPLVIRSSSQTPAVIEVQVAPLRLQAETVRLELIELVPAAEGPEIRDRLVDVVAQQLAISGCRFFGPASADGAEVQTAVRWALTDAADPTSGQLTVQESAFLQSGTALDVRSPLNGARFENVLKTGAGELLRLTQGARAGYRAPMVLNRCTLRESGPLVLLSGESFQQAGQLSIQGSDTVVAPADGEPLICIESDTFPPSWMRHVEVSAQGIVLAREVQLAAFRTPEASSANLPLPSDELLIDGLLTGRFRFSGSDLRSAEASVATAENVPLRLAGTVIGADLRRGPSSELQEESDDSAAIRFTPAASIPYNSRESPSPAREQP